MDGLLLQNHDGSIDHIPNVQTIISSSSSSESTDSTSENPDQQQRYDIIVLACKSYGLQGALDAIEPYVHSEVAILPLLNGMAHMDIIQERFASATVLGGTCGIVASLDSQTGIIKRMTPGKFIKAGVLSDSSSSSSRKIKDDVSNLIDLLKESGIDAQLNNDNILQSMWDKWEFLTTLAAATCLMNASIGQILSTDYGATFLHDLHEECQKVVIAEGSTKTKDDEATLQKYQQVFANKNSIVKASMCRDMEGGGPTEADHVIGDMIRRATKHNIPTPLVMYSIF